MYQPKKYAQFLFVLILGSFVLGACSSSPEQQILGQWYNLEVCSNLEFFADGTALLHQDGSQIGDYRFLDESRVRLDLATDGSQEPALLQMEATQDGFVLQMEMAAQRQTFYAVDNSNARQNADTYLNCALIHHQEGAYDLAIADYSEAIEMDPTYTLLYTNRADAYYQMGDYPLAMRDYGEAIDTDPQEALFYVARGDLYYQMGEFESAITDYSEAIGIDPKNTNVLHKRGDVYYEQEAYSTAVKDYSDVIRLDPQEANAFYRRADAYYRQGEYELAIADYTESIRFSPDYAMAYLFRGWAYETKDKTAQAAADYKQAIALGLSDQNQSWAEERLSSLE